MKIRAWASVFDEGAHPLTPWNSGGDNRYPIFTSRKDAKNLLTRLGIGFKVRIVRCEIRLEAPKQ